VTWIATRGPLATIKRIKSIRLHTTRFLCGDPLHESTDPSLGLDKKGLPKCLGPLKDLVLSEDPNARRLLLTLLRVSTCIKAEGIVDVRSIESPPEKVITHDLKKEFILTLQELK